MHAKTMEGLIGARTNINLSNVPMRVYKEARRKGDFATMERSMGYITEYEETAFDYKDKATEGMKEEAREAKEKEKLERQEAIEKRREERKELTAQTEAKIQENRDQVQLSTKSNNSCSIEDLTVSNTENNADKTAAAVTTTSDIVELSTEGKMLSKSLHTSQHSKVSSTQAESPAFYSSTGLDKGIAKIEHPKLNISV